MLTMGYYTAFSQSWDASQKAYFDVQALLSDSRFEQYSKLLGNLSRAHKALQAAKRDGSLMRIPNGLLRFTEALAVLQTRVSADFDLLV